MLRERVTMREMQGLPYDADIILAPSDQHRRSR
jgi:hypothetical protein